MKVEIWSDIMCPFCYIGKRKFEEALEQFAHKDDLQVEWKSFQLNPDLKTQTDKNIYEYLAEQKGWTLEYSRNVHAQMTTKAKESGLEYNFDSVIPANSFNAHRLSHLASKYNLQDAAEERLFKAYFTEGKNIDDIHTLVQLGIEIGLKEEEVLSMLQSDLYAQQVYLDMYEAQQIGVKGVPFFVMDRKYAVSGAQPDSVFLGALQKAYQEFEKDQLATATSNADGAACSIDGNC
ncbi:DsbA family oxidoreductase [Chitinophagaceae bacterium LB-8]|uniref:DsbA family oxidoreductase n=1 Tax=Paraflavisolibacter caeni TaxID=2982496 RepID=A0A9X3BHR3_9BACT|nr:DsbA family oxidoreductase [Paraflavisolibacter caeni]MCU7550072.1 DsbA family oxidoreductase [Paraflavisolibacter caeni]